ncbi:hypothetical protein C8R47DRAFT_1208721 [Mycena vitilis]|nr:hypothetical protein C8R47DRAFT_1208721 [Mycena vitilis]
MEKEKRPATFSLCSLYRARTAPDCGLNDLDLSTRHHSRIPLAAKYLPIDLANLTPSSSSSRMGFKAPTRGQVRVQPPREKVMLRRGRRTLVAETDAQNGKTLGLSLCNRPNSTFPTALLPVDREDSRRRRSNRRAAGPRLRLRPSGDGALMKVLSPTEAAAEALKPEAPGHRGGAVEIMRLSGEFHGPYVKGTYMSSIVKLAGYSSRRATGEGNPIYRSSPAAGLASVIPTLYVPHSPHAAHTPSDYAQSTRHAILLTCGYSLRVSVDVESREKVTLRELVGRLVTERDVQEGGAGMVA